MRSDGFFVSAIRSDKMRGWFGAESPPELNEDELLELAEAEICKAGDVQVVKMGLPLGHDGNKFCPAAHGACLREVCLRFEDRDGAGFAEDYCHEYRCRLPRLRPVGGEGSL